MASPALNRLRKLWFNVHMWIGVALFVILVPLSVSGVILAWRPEIDRVSHPERYQVSGGDPVLGPSAYLSAASHALGPAFKPDRITYPARPGSPVLVYSASRGGRVGAWLDPPTGRVLALGPVSDPLVGVMHDIHEELLVPGVGRQAVGVFGVFMLIQAMTGLWLWWPRARGFLSGLSWRRSPFLDARLHYFTGFWVSVPLVVLAASGIVLAFPSGGGPPPRGDRHDAARSPSPHIGITADQALVQAQTLSAGARLVSISAPNPGTPAWRFQFMAADAPIAVKVEDCEGGQPELSKGRRTDALSKWSGRLHAGDDFGLVWRIICTIAGLAPVLFAITGVMQWLRGRRGRAPS